MLASVTNLSLRHFSYDWVVNKHSAIHDVAGVKPAIVLHHHRDISLVCLHATGSVTYVEEDMSLTIYRAAERGLQLNIDHIRPPTRDVTDF